MSEEEQEFLDLLGEGVGHRVKKVYFQDAVGFTVEGELSSSEVEDLIARAVAHGHRVPYRRVNDHLRLVVVL